MQFLKEHGADLLDNQSSRGFDAIVRAAGITSSRELVAEIPNATVRGAVAADLVRVAPVEYFDTMNFVPDTSRNLATIKAAALGLGKTDEDPFTVLSAQTDAYQHREAVLGAIQGVIETKGVEGISGILNEAITSNDSTWLDGVASYIATSNSSTKGLDWKKFSPDIVSALKTFAAANWPQERAALLGSKLQ